MIEITALYRHKYWDNLVQVTDYQDHWVEFTPKATGGLAWLEESVFLQAYDRYKDGEAVTVDIIAERIQAQKEGRLVPREFLKGAAR